MDLFEYYYKIKLEKGTSMGELAEYFVINRTTLSQMIHHKTAPSYKMCKKIEKLTGGEVTVWEMMKAFSDAEDRRAKNAMKEKRKKKEIETEHLTGKQLSLPI